MSVSGRQMLHWLAHGIVERPISSFGNRTNARNATDLLDYFSRTTVNLWSPVQKDWAFTELAFAAIIVWYAVSILRMHYGGAEAPLIGVRSILEPQILVSWGFFRNAAKVLNEGYSKFPDRIWRFTRADVDMLVLPPKYVPELRSLPHSIASPTVAHAFNLSGNFTNMNIILKNNLHFRTLQEKLTPNLNKLTRPMQDELDHAINMELPECGDDWVAFKPYHTILSIVSRISARIFLGSPWCRNKEWLEISTQFTENTFISLVILRVAPRYLHRFIAWCLPSVWRANNYINRAKKLLGPEIRSRQARMRAGEKVDEADTLLSWMIEIANEEESKSEDLAHLEVVISLASIHTSHMNAVHVLYDLAAHPECIDQLRDEISTAIREEGPWATWTKKSFYKLKKLDSFMRESQRHSPPTLLSYHRVITQDHVLSDGAFLPRGVHITMPVNAIQNDTAVTPDPDTFDPMRYYRLRQAPNEAHLHQFSTTEPRVLNFGHGKNACPGRFFAALEIKCILVKLLMDYDFQLKEGETRPPNLSAHEFVFPNQQGELLMRRRKQVSEL